MGADNHAGKWAGNKSAATRKSASSISSRPPPRATLSAQWNSCLKLPVTQWLCRQMNSAISAAASRSRLDKPNAARKQQNQPQRCFTGHLGLEAQHDLAIGHLDILGEGFGRQLEASNEHRHPTLAHQEPECIDRIAPRLAAGGQDSAIRAIHHLAVPQPQSTLASALVV